MIQSWKDQRAALVFAGNTPKGFPADLARTVRRRLFQIHAPVAVEDLRVPPGNRLHKLSGDREGQWSVSVNDQFRICFVWGSDGPERVEFVDYH